MMWNCTNRYSHFIVHPTNIYCIVELHSKLFSCCLCNRSPHWAVMFDAQHCITAHNRYLLPRSMFFSIHMCQGIQPICIVQSNFIHIVGVTPVRVLILYWFSWCSMHVHEPFHLETMLCTNFDGNQDLQNSQS